MSVDSTLTLARNLVDYLDQRNLEGVVGCAAAGAKWHGFMSPEPLDNAGYQQMMSGLLEAFPDSRFTVDDVVAEDDRGAVRHTFQGTQRGDFAGIPATGKHVVVPATFTFHVSGGKITEGWLNADFLGLLMQLGVVPPPGR